MLIDGMKVLSVDDNRNNLLMIEVFAKNLNINIDSYEFPIEALNKSKEESYDLIVVDYMMPEMDGLSFISKIREFDEKIPIIMVTAVGDDINLHQNALSVGATEFLTKPIEGTLFKLRVKNLLELRKSQRLLENKAELLEEEVRKATRDIIESELETLTVVGKTAEYKDPETGEHIVRVSEYAKTLAIAYGLPEHMQEIIYYASPLHDIGKVGIPDHILLKPSSLNDEEWEVMKTHPLIGYEILKKSKSRYLKAGAVIAFTHHEKYDGTGYPKGLKGESIPLFGRIVAICDVFDALISKRPYKDAWPIEEAVNTIVKEKGKHFDPYLVDLFVENIEKIYEIFNETLET